MMNTILQSINMYVSKLNNVKKIPAMPIVNDEHDSSFHDFQLFSRNDPMNIVSDHHLSGSSPQLSLYCVQVDLAIVFVDEYLCNMIMTNIIPFGSWAIFHFTHF